MIRVAIKDDLAAVNDLFKEMLFSITANPNQCGYTDNYLEKFVSNSGNIIFLDVEDNDIVGFISVELYRNPEEYIYIDDFCVSKKYRNKGFGKSLFFESLNYAIKNNIETIYLHAEKNNTPALSFYKSFCFDIIEEVDNRLKLCLKLPKLTKYIVKNNNYICLKLLGKGKGGYTYKAIGNNNNFVALKLIHHEPCDYYTFGNKFASEINDYKTLTQIGIPMPRLIDSDEKQEIIIKELIDGPTISEMLSQNIDITIFLKQVKDIASLLESNDLNIDYYPTNFMIKNNQLLYVDYECNNYMDEWSFDSWGIKYWIKSNGNVI